MMMDSEIQMLEFSGWRRDYEPKNRARGQLFDSIAELKELFIETGYSKVYQNSLDDMGYVHSDLFKKPKV
jgi:hypothetical protein